MQTQTSNTLHNAIMEAGSKDHPPMLAPSKYVQWKSRIKRYIDTKPNHELIHYCLENPPYELGWKDKKVPTSEGRIDNDIYSTVDACPNAYEMWKAIERLKQERINHQTSVARTPEQNDVVERRNHTLVEAARTMLSAAKVPLLFWVKADSNNAKRAGFAIFLMFDELLNGSSKVVSKSSAVSAADAPNQQQVIGNPSQSIRTRRQLESDAEMCMFALTVSQNEPKNIKEAMTDSAWIESMQEELHQFNRLDVLPSFDFDTVFDDLDHAGCLDSLKSTSGGIQFLGGDKLVSWSSKKQDCTSMSSAEANYVSLSTCCAQVLWMRTQLTDYGFHFDKIPMYCDSKEAIAISCNPVQHLRTKNIDVRYHFIKEKVEKGIVELFFVGTKYQLADLFTKALLVERFQYLVR
nr:retrovirus-related Pol polyprotein from transposon TNT 1-94 [Tanacetum cinerariifolium]